MPRPPLADLPQAVDIIVVGAGINGAGIFRELVRTKLDVLLLDQNDYASGTSSASSKLIHGGLRYLRTGQWRLTLESVRERRRLLEEAPGLVDAQEFLMPIYRGMRPGKWTMRLGLWLYDLMAGQRSSRWVDAAIALKREPHLRREGLLGGMQYHDARTDDSRLVLRLIFESLRRNGGGRTVTARNYTRVVNTLEQDGRVVGVTVKDAETDEERSISARLVIWATGASAAKSPSAPALRPLRGSHLVFSRAKLPVGRAVSWLHPKDRRPVFAYPWLGAVLYGTTDLDHTGDDSVPPRMSRAEADYLVEGLLHQFPECRLRLDDAISSYAGVRPIVSSGKADPSAESRESATWSRAGEVGVAGGKLTTFRVLARDVLKLASRQLPELAPASDQRLFEKNSHADPVEQRFGSNAAGYHEEMSDRDQSRAEGHGYRLADLRWSARHEHVVHLDDLLLRRTRLGLVEEQAARARLPDVATVMREELGWDEERWLAEQERYLDIWQRDHSPVNKASQA